MAYSNIEIYTTDIDWFVFDSNNVYIHAASAGSVLPELIRVNNEQNEQNFLLVSSLEKRYFEREYEINPNIIELAQIKEQDLQLYLRDFVAMAQKGFYSFDKTNINNPEDTIYHLVAKPQGNAKMEKRLFSQNFMIENSLLGQIDSWQSIDLISIIDKASLF